MHLVHFSEPDEFIAEVRRDGGAADDGVVRISQVCSHAGHITSVRIIATFVRAGVIRRLDHRVGEVLPIGSGRIEDLPHNAAVLGLAEACATMIGSAARACGLDVRNGQLVPVGRCA